MTSHNVSSDSAMSASTGTASDRSNLSDDADRSMLEDQIAHHWPKQHRRGSIDNDLWEIETYTKQLTLGGAQSTTFAEVKRKLTQLILRQLTPQQSFALPSNAAATDATLSKADVDPVDAEPVVKHRHDRAGRSTFKKQYKSTPSIILSNKKTASTITSLDSYRQKRRENLHVDDDEPSMKPPAAKRSTDKDFVLQERPSSTATTTPNTPSSTLRDRLEVSQTRSTRITTAQTVPTIQPSSRSISPPPAGFAHIGGIKRQISPSTSSSEGSPTDSNSNSPDAAAGDASANRQSSAPQLSAATLTPADQSMIGDSQVSEVNHAQRLQQQVDAQATANTDYPGAAEETESDDEAPTSTEYDTSLEVELPATLRCPLCHLFLYKPVTLQCGHSTCQSCLLAYRDMYASAETAEASAIAGKCPYLTCRQPQILHSNLNLCIALASALERGFPTEHSYAKMYHQSVADYENGAYKHTLAALNDLIEAVPNTIQYHCLRILCYLQLSRFPEAIADANLIAELYIIQRNSQVDPAVQLHRDQQASQFNNADPLQTAVALANALSQPPSTRALLAPSTHILSTSSHEAVDAVYNTPRADCAFPTITQYVTSYVESLQSFGELAIQGKHYTHAMHAYVMALMLTILCTPDAKSVHEAGAEQVTNLYIAGNQYHHPERWDANGKNIMDNNRSDIEAMEDDCGTVISSLCEKLSPNHQPSATYSPAATTADPSPSSSTDTGSSQDSPPFSLVHGFRRLLIEQPPVSAIYPELQCMLCMSVLYDPVTTECGHTFCRLCLQRSLDYHTNCPTCRTMISRQALPSNQHVNVSLLAIEKNWLPKRVARRAAAQELAIRQEAEWLPIFVVTLLYPHILCPLHIFEPRYRLLVRNVVQNGTYRFGMCLHAPQSEGQFSEVGTIAVVRSVSLLHDGRAIVEVVGERRFVVQERSMRNGYVVAKVAYFDDMNEEEERKLIGSRQPTLSDLVTYSRTHTPAALQRVLNRVNAPTNMSIPTDRAHFAYWLMSLLPVSVATRYHFLQLRTHYERYQLLATLLDRILARPSNGLTLPSPSPPPSSSGRSPSNSRPSTRDSSPASGTRQASAGQSQQPPATDSPRIQPPRRQSSRSTRNTSGSSDLLSPGHLTRDGGEPRHQERRDEESENVPFNNLYDSSSEESPTAQEPRRTRHMSLDGTPPRAPVRSRTSSGNTTPSRRWGRQNSQAEREVAFRNASDCCIM